MPSTKSTCSLLLEIVLSELVDFLNKLGDDLKGGEHEAPPSDGWTVSGGPLEGMLPPMKLRNDLGDSEHILLLSRNNINIHVHVKVIIQYIHCTYVQYMNKYVYSTYMYNIYMYMYYIVGNFSAAKNYVF